MPVENQFMKNFKYIMLAAVKDFFLEYGEKNIYIYTHPRYPNFFYVAMKSKREIGKFNGKKITEPVLVRPSQVDPNGKFVHYNLFSQTMYVFNNNFESINERVKRDIPRRRNVDRKILDETGEKFQSKYKKDVR